LCIIILDEKIIIANKKLTNQSRNFNMNIEINEKKLSHTQTKASQLQSDKDELRKIIENREDVIKHWRSSWLKTTLTNSGKIQILLFA